MDFVSRMEDIVKKEVDAVPDGENPVVEILEQLKIKGPVCRI